MSEFKGQCHRPNGFCTVWHTAQIIALTGRHSVTQKDATFSGKKSQDYNCKILMSAKPGFYSKQRTQRTQRKS